MARSKKILLVIAALSIIAAIITLKMSKEDIVLGEIRDCPIRSMHGSPTIMDYGNNFIVLQTLEQKKIHVGQSYGFEHIIFGPPYRAKVVLVSDDSQRNYLITFEDLHTVTSANDNDFRWIRRDCKQLVDGSWKSLLSDISSLFLSFDSLKWEITDAIEMISGYERFKSNATHHYVIFIKGKSREVPGKSAKFDATVDVLSFATLEDARQYYRVQNDILKNNAWGRTELSINTDASEYEAYCYDFSKDARENGCIFIGRSNDMVVEIKLFPQSEKANLEQVKLYWPEFVQNLWPSVLGSYDSLSTMP